MSNFSKLTKKFTHTKKKSSQFEFTVGTHFTGYQKQQLTIRFPPGLILLFLQKKLYNHK